MIHKIKLVPINPKMVLGNASTILPTSYTINGRFRYLLSEREYKEIDYSEAAAKNYNLPKIGNYVMNVNKKDLEFQYETKTNEKDELIPASETDRLIKDTVNVFWGQHPMLVLNGKPHFNTNNSPMFNLVDLVKQDAKNFATFEQKLEVAQTIKAMTFEQKKELCYYYGISPYKKTDAQLLLTLADFQTGICMSNDNATEFLKVWGEGNADERNYRIYANKAIEDQTVVNRQNEGRNNYYLGETYLGTTIEDIILFFKRENKLYTDYVQRRSKEKSESNESIAMEKMAKGEKAFKDNDEEVNAMKNKIRDLMKDGHLPSDTRWHVMGVDKLKATLEQGLKVKGEKEMQKA